MNDHRVTLIQRQRNVSTRRAFAGQQNDQTRKSSILNPLRSLQFPHFLISSFQVAQSKTNLRFICTYIYTRLLLRSEVRQSFFRTSAGSLSSPTPLPRALTGILDFVAVCKVLTGPLFLSLSLSVLFLFSTFTRDSKIQL